MSTKEILQRRKDIPDDQVEELVARAAKLQDQATETSRQTASPSDVEAVAAELDIAPEYVEQAIAGWRQEQSNLSADNKRSRIAKRRKKILGVMAGLGLVGRLGIGVATLTAFSMLGWQGLALIGLAGVGLMWFLFWLIT